jgi:phosphomannomutase
MASGVNGSPIKFGTDGWRGIIADDFTFQNVRICAQATARYFRETGLASRGVVVGYDTRFASEGFAEAVAEVLTGNDIPVYLCDETAPTPVVGYSVLSRKAAGAVVITASHNPGAYSGFKVRTHEAGSAPPETLARIEAYIPEAQASRPARLTIEEARAKGLLEMINPRPAYIQHLANLVDLERLKKAGLLVVADSMHGAGAGYFREVLAGGDTVVMEIRSERNPCFPDMHNPEPIPRNLEPAMDLVLEEDAMLGLATDGDADRIGVIDHHGKFVNQLLTFGLLAYYLLEERGLRGPMVKSVTTTSMIWRLGELYGVPVHETPVGFKHLGPKMIETDAIIAGEESGGFAFRGHLPERDGILSGLYILDLVQSRRKDLPALIEELFSSVGPHYYDRIDVRMSEEERRRVEETLPALEPKEIAGLAVTGYDRTDGLRFLLEDGAWALIRLSGTEPLMRIYAEVPRAELVQPVLNAVRRLAGS